MFPSKLYEVQLSPPQKKYSCNEIFMDDLTLDNSRLAQLLEEDGKELSDEIPKSLLVLLQENFCPGSSPSQFERMLLSKVQSSIDVPDRLRQRISGQMDELLLLMLTSFVFKSKIIIYSEHKNNLQSQIVNFGYKSKFYLSKVDNRYLKVSRQNSDQFEMNMILDETEPVSPSKSKQPDTDHYQKSRFEGSGSTMHSSVTLSSPKQQGEQTFEEMFSTPPKMAKNDLLASLSIEQQQRYSGKLKFYDEQKSYGFIVMDIDGSDIFVHSDDLLKAGVSKEILKSSKQGFIIRFSFACLSYIGKYKKSRKAVDLLLLQQQTGYPSYFGMQNSYSFYEAPKPQFFETYRNFNYTQ